eukprot:jgi/Mesvir1/24599/Mv21917-RA.1
MLSEDVMLVVEKANSLRESIVEVIKEETSSRDVSGLRGLDDTGDGTSCLSDEDALKLQQVSQALDTLESQLRQLDAVDFQHRVEKAAALASIDESRSELAQVVQNARNSLSHSGSGGDASRSSSSRALAVLQETIDFATGASSANSGRSRPASEAGDLVSMLMGVAPEGVPIGKTFAGLGARAYLARERAAASVGTRSQPTSARSSASAVAGGAASVRSFADGSSPSYTAQQPASAQAGQSSTFTPAQRYRPSKQPQDEDLYGPYSVYGTFDADNTSASGVAGTSGRRGPTATTSTPARPVAVATASKTPGKAAAGKASGAGEGSKVKDLGVVSRSWGLWAMTAGMAAVGMALVMGGPKKGHRRGRGLPHHHSSGDHTWTAERQRQHVTAAAATAVSDNLARSQLTAAQKEAAEAARAAREQRRAAAKAKSDSAPVSVALPSCVTRQYCSPGDGACETRPDVLRGRG